MNFQKILGRVSPVLGVLFLMLVVPLGCLAQTSFPAVTEPPLSTTSRMLEETAGDCQLLQAQINEFLPTPYEYPSFLPIQLASGSDLLTRLHTNSQGSTSLADMHWPPECRYTLYFVLRCRRHGSGRDIESVYCQRLLASISQAIASVSPEVLQEWARKENPDTVSHDSLEILDGLNFSAQYLVEIKDLKAHPRTLNLKRQEDGTWVPKCSLHHGQTGVRFVDHENPENASMGFPLLPKESSPEAELGLVRASEGYAGSLTTGVFFSFLLMGFLAWKSLAGKIGGSHPMTLIIVCASLAYLVDIPAPWALWVPVIQGLLLGLTLGFFFLGIRGSSGFFYRMGLRLILGTTLILPLFRYLYVNGWVFTAVGAGFRPGPRPGLLENLYYFFLVPEWVGVWYFYAFICILVSFGIPYSGSSQTPPPSGQE